MSRIIDRGALVAGWIGAGVALIIVIAVELIIAVQPFVLLAAMPAGAAVGAYANVRAQRRRPRRRVMANALWAGAVTGLVLAVLYVAVRLIFIYADTGVLPDNTRLDCPRGPACGYARFVEAGRADELAEIGVTDATTFEAAILAELQAYGMMLFVATLGGAAVAGTVQSMSGGSRRAPEGEAGPEAAAV